MSEQKWDRSLPEVSPGLGEGLLQEAVLYGARVGCVVPVTVPVPDAVTLAFLMEPEWASVFLNQEARTRLRRNAKS